MAELVWWWGGVGANSITRALQGFPNDHDDLMMMPLITNKRAHYENLSTSASRFGQKEGFAGRTKRGRSIARAGVASYKYSYLYFYLYLNLYQNLDKALSPWWNCRGPACHEIRIAEKPKDHLEFGQQIILEFGQQILLAFGQQIIWLFSDVFLVLSFLFES